jgi:hypothetical protein
MPGPAYPTPEDISNYLYDGFTATIVTGGGGGPGSRVQPYKCDSEAKATASVDPGLLAGSVTGPGSSSLTITSFATIISLPQSSGTTHGISSKAVSDAGNIGNNRFPG